MNKQEIQDQLAHLQATKEQFEKDATAYAQSICPFKVGDTIDCKLTFFGKKMLVEEVNFKTKRTYRSKDFDFEIVWEVKGTVFKKDGTLSKNTCSFYG